MIPNKIQSVEKKKLETLWIDVDISDVSNTLDIFNIQETNEISNQNYKNKEIFIRSNDIKNNLNDQKLYKLQLASIKKKNTPMRF